MKIWLPGEQMAGLYIAVELDDGRMVRLFGDGGISVGARVGGDDEYVLTLPSIDWAGSHCDGDAPGNGHFTIQAEHCH